MSLKANLEWIRNNKTNKSTAFTKSERLSLNLEGLLPHRESNQELQVKRVMLNLSKKPNDIEKYLFLSALQTRNERLFYKVLDEYIEELLPIIYTPTVGQACKEFSNTYTEAKGFYITPEDKGGIFTMLDNWPEKDIKVIVVTDGERILGLGDLGSNGMGIPIGKLVLYSACAGIDPSHCLPVMIDIGTNNEELLNDPFYLGYPHKRITGSDYLDILDEFMEAVTTKYPNVLVQFEDFLTPNAFSLLKRYRDKYRCFNDDIQGTASVALAGVLASSRLTGISFKDYKIMFLGAGSAATGIADLMLAKLIDSGLSHEEACNNLSFCDVHGLLVKSRTDLQSHNLPYAKEAHKMSFMDAIKELKPNVLIGATGAPGTFTKDVVELMSEMNEKPVIFALSNPTSKAECTAEQAYIWSNGRAIFVSGSPFSNVVYNGKTYDPGQGNNAYIFPGLGLGIVAGNIKHVPDELLMVAAEKLASLVSENDLDFGALYPPIREIKSLSIELAEAVIQKAIEMKISDVKPENVKSLIQDVLYSPIY